MTRRPGTRLGSPRAPSLAGAAALVLFVVVSVALVACVRPSRREPFVGRVVGVADGDTITVLDGRSEVRVRLNGIDCPERGQPFAANAKRLTSELAFGRSVTVEPRDTDRYGRTIADVTLPDGRVLNRELVAAGMAWHYRRYSDDETLARLERRAREARAGIWSDPRPVAPWELRESRR